MKVVIDIDEVLYKKIRLLPDTEIDTESYMAIKYGTPLPEGHGDLIDRSKLHTNYVGTELGTDLEVYLQPTVDYAPTVISGDQHKEVNMLHAFNINNWIKVKLTDKGREILQNYWNRICSKFPQLDPDPSYFATHTDADGYTRFQLWEFMQIFGEHLCLGSPLYVENNEILFEMSITARTE